MITFEVLIIVKCEMLQQQAESETSWPIKPGHLGKNKDDRKGINVGAS